MTRDAAVITAGRLEDAFGRHMRQQLGWLGFATLPLLFPVALPGMATSIGAVLLALGVAANRPLRLPGWHGRRNLPPRAAELLQRWSGGALRAAAGPAPVHTTGYADTDPRAIRWADSGSVVDIAGERPVQPVLST